MVAEVVPCRPRDRAKEQFWRGIIRRQQQTDLPISAFCQREGLELANFLGCPEVDGSARTRSVALA
jgi:hypothetical protein